MKEVGTAHLKNNLSAYLKKVDQGDRFIVTDRGRPIAKLVPIDDKSGELTNEEKLAAMARCGLVTLPKSKSGFTFNKKIDLGGDMAQRYLKEERDSW